MPYLADLVGVAGPAAGPDRRGRGRVSRRAFVANTVAYRRRKGTVAVVEQVARDAIGLAGQAVEYYRLLATTAHVNHVRTRPARDGASPDARRRGPAPLELVPAAVAQGALDRAGPHRGGPADRLGPRPLRHPERRRLPVPGPGVRAPAGRRRAPPAGRRGLVACTRCGWPTPLFARPAAEERASSTSPPRRTCRCRCGRGGSSRCWSRPGGCGDRIAAAAPLPVAVRVDGVELDAERICGCAAWRTSPPAPVRAIRLRRLAGDGRRRRPGGCTRSATGLARRPAGAGGPARLRRDRGRRRRHLRPHRGARAGPRRRPVPRRPRPRRSRRDGPGSWSPPTTPPGSRDPASPRRSTPREDAWDGPDSPAGGTSVVAIGDSARYAGISTVRVPPCTRCPVAAARPVVVAARGVSPQARLTAAGLRPHLRDAHGHRAGRQQRRPRRARDRGRRDRDGRGARLADGQQLHRRRHGPGRRGCHDQPRGGRPDASARSAPAVAFGPAAATLGTVGRQHAGRRSGGRRAAAPDCT